MRCNLFSGSLKIILNKRNIFFNFITKIFSRPKIFPKDIQIFHYFLHVRDFGHVRSLLKNRARYYHMDCSDINHEQYFARAWHYFLLFCCCFFEYLSYKPLIGSLSRSVYCGSDAQQRVTWVGLQIGPTSGFTLHNAMCRTQSGSWRRVTDPTPGVSSVTCSCHIRTSMAGT